MYMKCRTITTCFLPTQPLHVHSPFQAAIILVNIKHFDQGMARLVSTQQRAMNGSLFCRGRLRGPDVVAVTGKLASHGDIIQEKWLSFDI